MRSSPVPETDSYTLKDASKTYYAPYRKPQDFDRVQGRIIETTMKTNSESITGRAKPQGNQTMLRTQDRDLHEAKGSGRRVRQCCACAAHAPVKCLRYYARTRSRESGAQGAGEEMSLL